MKKKVLLLPTHFPTSASPIVGSQIQEQAQLMADDFDIVVCFCLPGMGWKRFMWEKVTGLFRKRQRYSSCEKDLLPGTLRVRGVYYFQSPRFSYARNHRLRIAAYTYLFEQLRSEGWRPDLVHARGHEGGGAVARALKADYGIPYVLTENVALVVDGNLTPERVDTYRRVIDDADAVLYVSSWLMRITLLHGIGLKSRHIVVGNWINEDKFAVRTDISTENKGPFTIFITGYNSYIKDFETFFKAIKCLVELGERDIKALIAVTYFWSEENKNGLIELARSLGVLDNCEFLYQVPRERMPGYYSHCDVYVSTSLTETFGIAAAEALFCGVPVISTDNGGVSDFVNDVNGSIVALRDHEAIARALLAIKRRARVYDPQMVRSSVLHKFGTEAFRSRVSTAYITVLGAPTAAKV